ncbi:hypothetical protein [Bacillus sp. Marseille-P3661]|uniref:hypothetical protein n=1 Tax=Bacillus sp. Marseille-P3661 TaxID=1936234 RepID=UPI002155D18A|nr:hypothetical protein [Bacillus sp. Marseille-P3661]
MKVAKLQAVNTPECSACISCIEACPVKGTLNMTIANKKVNKWVIPTSFLLVFFTVFIVAKITGFWNSTIPYEEYKQLIPIIEYLGH